MAFDCQKEREYEGTACIMFAFFFIYYDIGITK